MPRPSCFIIEFDHRADDGPDRVGPFTSRGAANAWVDSLYERSRAEGVPAPFGGSASYTIVPVTSPQDQE